MSKRIPSITKIKAALAYRAFTTSFSFPIVTRTTRARLNAAQQFWDEHRSAVTMLKSPKRALLHHFQGHSGASARKGQVLLVHGWGSRALHMSAYIRELLNYGYDVHALDLPAHGENPRGRIYWHDSVNAIVSASREIGPVHAAIGHSYGGMMLGYSLVASKLDSRISDELNTQKLVLLASPTRLSTPVKLFTRMLRCSLEERGAFEKRILADTRFDSIDELSLSSLWAETVPSCDIQIVHGKQDKIVSIADSQYLAKTIDKASLTVLEGVGHVRILSDERLVSSVVASL